MAMAQPPSVIYISTLRRRRPLWPAAATATVLVGIAAALVRGLG
jgi:hypothetical protein